jgi:hypothetical protein
MNEEYELGAVLFIGLAAVKPFGCSEGVEDTLHDFVVDGVQCVLHPDLLSSSD